MMYVMYFAPMVCNVNCAVILIPLNAKTNMKCNCHSVRFTDRGRTRDYSTLLWKECNVAVVYPWHETNTQKIRQEFSHVFARVRLQARHVFAPKGIPSRIWPFLRKIIPQEYLPVFAQVRIQAPHVLAQNKFPKIFSCMYWFCARGNSDSNEFWKSENVSAIGDDIVTCYIPKTHKILQK